MEELAATHRDLDFAASHKHTTWKGLVYSQSCSYSSLKAALGFQGMEGVSMGAFWVFSVVIEKVRNGDAKLGLYEGQSSFRPGVTSQTLGHGIQLPMAQATLQQIQEATRCALRKEDDFCAG